MIEKGRKKIKRHVAEENVNSVYVVFFDDRLRIEEISRDLFYSLQKKEMCEFRDGNISLQINITNHSIPHLWANSWSLERISTGM